MLAWPFSSSSGVACSKSEPVDASTAEPGTRCPATCGPFPRLRPLASSNRVSRGMTKRQTLLCSQGGFMHHHRSRLIAASTPLAVMLMALAAAAPPAAAELLYGTAQGALTAAG